MKKLIFILIVTLGLAACNGGEDQSYTGQYDTVHVQSVPSVGITLHNAGYDTAKALIVLPLSKQ